MITRNEDIKQEVDVIYQRNLIERSTPSLVFARFGQNVSYKANSGTNVLKFRRYSNLQPNTNELEEGVTPVGNKVNTTEILAVVKPYGDFVTLTDVVERESIDNVLDEINSNLADQMANTLDILTRDVLCSGTNVRFSNGTSRSDIGAANKVSKSDFQKIVRDMKNNLVKPITSMVDPSNNYNTTPINACFIGICDPDTTMDLKNTEGFIPVEKYSNTKVILPNEIGAIDEIRFIETTNSKVYVGEGSTGIDVHATLILGKDAYGCVRPSTDNSGMIIKPLGASGTEDPLNQRGTSGWKTNYTAVILKPEAIVRYEHAVSA